jgi:integrase
VSHIELCRNVYFATLKVPKHLRERLGKTKFKRTLGTGDKRRAQELAKPLVALWKAQLRQADGEPEAVKDEALRWREALSELRRAGDESNAEAVEGLIVDKAEDIEQRQDLAAAQEFASVALGYSTPSRLHFDAWVASIEHLVPKARDQYKADVRLLTESFQTLEAMTPQALRQWTEAITTRGQAPVSPSSLKRMVSCWRSYWSYLQGQNIVPAESKPFGLIRLPRKGKAGGASKGGWLPFPAVDVPKLAAASKEAGDSPLADLISLAAYTGARIEELCSLEWKHVQEDSFRIIDAKTPAGIREVPIHPALQPLLVQLRKEAKDGYVLAGLTFNKYGDRSNAIGKRFGRLKVKLGYGDQHVFHSFRKTLVTLLEDAGVSENLAADIVGHEKPRITYGLYSGGASLATKAAALCKANYGLSVGRSIEQS